MKSWFSLLDLVLTVLFLIDMPGVYRLHLLSKAENKGIEILIGEQIYVKDSKTEEQVVQEQEEQLYRKPFSNYYVIQGDFKKYILKKKLLD